MKTTECFCMSTVNLILIIGVDSIGQGGNDLRGILFGLGAAAFFAAVIILIPYVACTGGMHLKGLDGMGWGCLLAVGLIHTGVTYCMYFSALKELTGQEAAILSYIDPLMAVVVSVVLLGESMTFRQLLGGILILGFTLWNEKNTK